MHIYCTAWWESEFDSGFSKRGLCLSGTIVKDPGRISIISNLKYEIRAFPGRKSLGTRDTDGRSANSAIVRLG